MRRITEFDFDLSRAGIHVTNARRKLGEARKNIKIQLEISQMRRRADRAAYVQSILFTCSNLLQEERNMLRYVHEGSYINVSDNVEHICYVLHI